MTLVLDAGAFVAAERGNLDVAVGIARELRAGRVAVTHGGVVGQIWRGGARRAVVSRLLAGVRVIALDEQLGRRAGALLARTSTSDVIDAALVLLAGDGDEIMTSDPRDLAMLACATGVHVELLAV